MLKDLRLAMQLLRQEWRALEWLIILLSLILAITTITAFHFYIDRLMHGIDLESAKLLGGDLVVESPTSLPTLWQQKAAQLGLRSAQVWSFPTVVSANNQLQLANIQAVSSTYPLFSKPGLLLRETVWVEPRLLPLLSIKMGDYLSIGASRFRIAKSLTTDVDVLNTGFTIAPRVLMHLDDISATKTVLPGSRVDYRLLLAGNKKSLQAFKQWIKPLLTPSQRLLEVHQQRFILQQSLYRAELYLQLVLLISLAMSGVAIAISTQQYVHRHYSHVALWKCLGAKQKRIMQFFLWQFLIIFLIAGCAGIMLGYFLQNLFANLFQEYVQFALPAPSIKPVFLGMITSALLLFTFACPILIDLPRTPPLFLWRHESIKLPFTNYSYIAAITMLALFLYGMMHFSLLALLFIDILLLSIGFLYAVSLLFLRGIKNLLPYFPLALRQGWNQLIHYPASIGVQITGFSLILTFLIVLGIIRGDLIKNWERSLPAHTPNYFAINIAVQDIPALEHFFLSHHIPITSIYPMIRGRLIALNDHPIMAVIPASARGHNALHRELNLSFMLDYPSDNKVTDGRSFNKNDENKPLISVEKNLATELHLRLGDKLTFQIGNEKRSAIITNLRQVEWKSFHPNFYVIFPPGSLNDFPATYITSFYLSPEQAPFLNEVIKAFPNLTIIDVAKLLQQVQTLIHKMSTTIYTLFLFSLAAGILIFIASVKASMDERKETYTLLRVLGSNKNYIYQSIIVEFTSLALIILAISILLAKLIVFLLDKMIFNF